MKKLLYITFYMAILGFFAENRAQTSTKSAGSGLFQQAKDSFRKLTGKPLAKELSALMEKKLDEQKNKIDKLVHFDGTIKKSCEEFTKLIDIFLKENIKINKDTQDFINLFSTNHRKFTGIKHHYLLLKSYHSHLYQNTDKAKNNIGAYCNEALIPKLNEIQDSQLQQVVDHTITQVFKKLAQNRLDLVKSIKFHLHVLIDALKRDKTISLTHYNEQHNKEQIVLNYSDDYYRSNQVALKEIEGLGRICGALIEDLNINNFNKAEKAKVLQEQLKNLNQQLISIDKQLKSISQVMRKHNALIEFKKSVEEDALKKTTLEEKSNKLNAIIHLVVLLTLSVEEYFKITFNQPTTIYKSRIIYDTIRLIGTIKIMYNNKFDSNQLDILQQLLQVIPGWSSRVEPERSSQATLIEFFSENTNNILVILRKFEQILTEENENLVPTPQVPLATAHRTATDSTADDISDAEVEDILASDGRYADLEEDDNQENASANFGATAKNFESLATQAPSVVTQPDPSTSTTLITVPSAAATVPLETQTQQSVQPTSLATEASTKRNIPTRQTARNQGRTPTPTNKNSANAGKSESSAAPAQLQQSNLIARAPARNTTGKHGVLHSTEASGHFSLDAPNRSMAVEAARKPTSSNNNAFGGSRAGNRDSWLKQSQ